MHRRGPEVDRDVLGRGLLDTVLCEAGEIDAV